MTWALVALPLALLVLGVPIFAVLLVTAAVVLTFFMNVPPTAVHQTMFGSVDSFSLMAVPFFLFAGDLMGRGGMARRLIDWILALCGNVRGTVPLAVVGTNTVFGAITGSTAACVASVGRFMYPRLRGQGYTERFSLGIVTSAGAIDAVIPPSIPLIIYGISAEQNIAKLFLAGLLPGLLMAVLTSLYVLWYARRHDMRDGERFAWSRVARTTRDGLWAIGSPLIILGGIYAGFFSPTEAGGVASIYAIFVTMFVYREIGWRDLWKAAVNTAYLTAQVLLIVAGAGVFAWLLTVNGIPQQVAAWFAAAGLSPIAFLLGVNLLLLVVGCFIDAVSAILVLTPLLLPIVKTLGIDPIHFGIVVVVNLAIGLFTPPFGLNIFVVQAMFRPPVRQIYAGVLPFIVIDLVALAIITYWPALSLVTTRLLG